MGPDNTPTQDTPEPKLPETIEEYTAMIEAAHPKPKREMPSADARRLGLMIEWILEDQFKDAVRLVEYAKRKKLPLSNVAMWMEAKVSGAAYGDTIVENMHGKRFRISVEELES